MEFILNEGFEKNVKLLEAMQQSIRKCLVASPGKNQTSCWRFVGDRGEDISAVERDK